MGLTRRGADGVDVPINTGGVSGKEGSGKGAARKPRDGAGGAALARKGPFSSFIKADKASDAPSFLDDGDGDGDHEIKRGKQVAGAGSNPVAGGQNKEAGMQQPRPQKAAQRTAPENAASSSQAARPQPNKSVNASQADVKDAPGPFAGNAPQLADSAKPKSWRSKLMTPLAGGVSMGFSAFGSLLMAILKGIILVPTVLYRGITGGGMGGGEVAGSKVKTGESLPGSGATEATGQANAPQVTQPAQNLQGETQAESQAATPSEKVVAQEQPSIEAAETVAAQEQPSVGEPSPELLELREFAKRFASRQFDCQNCTKAFDESFNKWSDGKVGELIEFIKDPEARRLYDERTNAIKDFEKSAQDLVGALERFLALKPEVEIEDMLKGEAEVLSACQSAKEVLVQIAQNALNDKYPVIIQASEDLVKSAKQSRSKVASFNGPGPSVLALGPRRFGPLSVVQPGGEAQSGDGEADLKIIELKKPLSVSQIKGSLALEQKADAPEALDEPHFEDHGSDDFDEAEEASAHRETMRP